MAIRTARPLGHPREHGREEIRPRPGYRAPHLPQRRPPGPRAHVPPGRARLWRVEVSRFKGLGEMPPASLKETTMDPRRRTLLKVVLPPEERARTAELMEALMGRRPELRFKFIQENAAKLDEAEVDV